uniref:Uncharacterized protein n=1 Tax=viral metagenome TaxID=1070528 RepID=A0A6M3XPV3_9ZZZZ
MAKDEISKDDISRYVNFGGEYCPFCISPEVQQDGPLFYDEDEAKVYRGMECLTCNRDWTDVFGLVDVLTKMPVVLKEEV